MQGFAPALHLPGASLQVEAATMPVEAAAMMEKAPSMQLEAAREQEKAAAKQVRPASLQEKAAPLQVPDPSMQQKGASMQVWTSSGNGAKGWRCLGCDVVPDPAASQHKSRPRLHLRGQHLAFYLQCDT